MEEQIKFLDEFTAYVRRNFSTGHVVIIEDAVEQFKHKLNLDAQEEAFIKANPKLLNDKADGILMDEYILHYKPKEDAPRLPTVEEIENGIHYMRAGMIGIDTTNGLPKALEYLYSLRKYLLH